MGENMKNILVKKVFLSVAALLVLCLLTGCAVTTETPADNNTQAAETGDNTQSGDNTQGGDTQLQPTEGLAYTLNDDGASYTVTKGTVTGGDVVIPATYNGLPVTIIGEDAFGDCEDLTSITIPDSITNIGEWAFSDCTGLTSITIPNGVTSIDKRAFYDCTGLTSVTIPDNVTTVENYAFYGCTGLTSVTIGSGVTSINGYAFMKCTGLTSITVDVRNSVYHSAGNCIIKTANKTLIAGCKTSVIPTDGSVTSIGAFAFYCCTGLTSVIIPDSVTSIDYYAFEGCTGLTSIAIPDSMTDIGECAFADCTAEIVWGASPRITSISDGAFTNYKGMNITIPDSVTSIGQHAFANCTNLTSISIPDNVTHIGWNAFNECTNLTCYTYDHAKYLGNTQNPYLALIEAGDISITSCIIHADTKVICDDAFERCEDLMSVTIGGNVTNIGENAFYRCELLTTITYQGTTAQWNAIEKGDDWNVWTGDYTVHCTDGEISKF